MESYELIDSDPSFNRVVRYMRFSDYASWIAGTAGAPGLLLLFEKLEPLEGKTFKMPAASLLRVSTTVGFIGGFLYAYSSSTKRFWGWTENSKEVSKDRYEVKKALSAKQSPWGKSRLSPYQQDMSSKNSQNSQLLLSIFPWFNFTSHQNHGIDLRKYYEVRQGEEKWGFELPPLEEVNDLAVGNQFKVYTNYP
ncbi:hypothetical protein PACTADRAFT_48621 [Pachysolen tannophilus NRRL Y-2460]|uniref:NADH-ubiquinone oxidoreductase 21kDa subunit N-terminal domain-containing protein n=1 Tax=Pachysolen tannophilus NRRL Y-2460 TaxID=669874 RepID=A0A1E4TYK4_PACTA|nr:hypothetical protein PACTADRAFT_48621 [Pachysolen tannophilus NRRL Y-2460]